MSCWTTRMRGSTCASPLLVIVAAAVGCVDSAQHLYAATGPSYGTLDLSSPSSTRKVHIEHSYVDEDLPGTHTWYDYYNPIIIGAPGVMYAFAASKDNDNIPSAILAYDLAQNTTTVYGDLPQAVYADCPSATTSPQFGTPILDESTGVFYFTTNSHVIDPMYSFTLDMLLAFNSRTGETTSLLGTLYFDTWINAVIFDPQSSLLFVAVEHRDDDSPNYTKHHRTAIFDTRGGVNTLTMHNFSSVALMSYTYAGVDPVANKPLTVHAAYNGMKQTNYEYGHLDCNNKTGCAFTSLGELDQMWSGPDAGFNMGFTDRIMSIAWDSAERLLSVRSFGCYNMSLGDFYCRGGVATEKFMQYNIPANPPTSPSRVVTAPSYAYMQATNGNDGLGINWGSLAMS